MPTQEQIEAAARAVAEARGENWECCCTAQRGLDCDCGDAITYERDSYDERLSREDCRMAAKAALRSALTGASAVGEAEPVAWLHEIIDPNKFGHNQLLSLSPDNPWSHWLESHRAKCTYTCTPLYAHPVSSSDGQQDARRDIAALIANIRWIEECFGETLEEEDAAHVADIEKRWLPAAPTKGGE